MTQYIEEHAEILSLPAMGGIAACKHVVDTGLAIRRRRAFVKTELRTVFGRLERLREDIVLAPKLQHLFFKVWSVVTAINFFK